MPALARLPHSPIPQFPLALPLPVARFFFCASSNLCSMLPTHARVTTPSPMRCAAHRSSLFLASSLCGSGPPSVFFPIKRLAGASSLGHSAADAEILSAQWSKMLTNRDLQTNILHSHSPTRDGHTTKTLRPHVDIVHSPESQQRLDRVHTHTPAVVDSAEVACVSAGRSSTTRTMSLNCSAWALVTRVSL